jgi:hypothetical protein
MQINLSNKGSSSGKVYTLPLSAVPAISGTPFGSTTQEAHTYQNTASPLHHNTPMGYC